MYDCVDTMAASLQILEGVIATLSVRLKRAGAEPVTPDLPTLCHPPFRSTPTRWRPR